MNDNRRIFLKKLGLGGVAAAGFAIAPYTETKAAKVGLPLLPKPVRTPNVVTVKETPEYIPFRSLDDFKEMIDSGHDRNIVVIDSDARCGQMTKRLVSLMKVVARRNGYNLADGRNSRLVRLYLSVEALAELEVDCGGNVLDPKRRIKATHCYGIRLLETMLLGEDYPLNDYYKKMSGTVFPPGDSELIIGELDDGTILLGSI